MEVYFYLPWYLRYLWTTIPKKTTIYICFRYFPISHANHVINLCMVHLKIKVHLYTIQVTLSGINSTYLCDKKSFLRWNLRSLLNRCEKKTTSVCLLYIYINLQKCINKIFKNAFLRRQYHSDMSDSWKNNTDSSKKNIKINRILENLNVTVLYFFSRITLEGKKPNKKAYIYIAHFLGGGYGYSLLVFNSYNWLWLTKTYDAHIKTTTEHYFIAIYVTMIIVAMFVNINYTEIHKLNYLLHHYNIGFQDIVLVFIIFTFILKQN